MAAIFLFSCTCLTCAYVVGHKGFIFNTDVHLYQPKAHKKNQVTSQPAWPSGQCIRLSSGQYKIPRLTSHCCPKLASTIACPPQLA